MTGIPREPTLDLDQLNYNFKFKYVLPIDWYEIYGLNSLTIGRKQSSQTSRISVNPRLAFTYPHSEITCFLEQTKNGSQFLRSFDCRKISPKNYRKPFDGFELKEDSKVLEQMKPYFKLTFYENKQKYLFYNISDPKEVVAIFSTLDKILFIFKENKRLTFCYTNGLNFVTSV